MSILENLESLKDQIKEELDKKNKIISQFQKDLEAFKEIKNKVANLESELQESNEKLKRIEEEKVEPFRNEISRLKTEMASLNKKLDGYRYSIKIISSWLPSQKESIDILINLSESKDHTISFEDLHKGTKIPLVVLKNRVIPLLVEKGLVKLTGESIKLLEIEE